MNKLGALKEIIRRNAGLKLGPANVCEEFFGRVRNGARLHRISGRGIRGTDSARAPARMSPWLAPARLIKAGIAPFSTPVNERRSQET